MKSSRAVMIASVAVAIIAVTGVIAGAGDRQSKVPQDTLITLERTPCFGFCPMYKVSITADGSVTFEGRDHVKMKGTHTGKIPVEAVRRLVEGFEKINYFSLKDRYRMPEDGCDGMVMDAPGAITSLRINGRQKTVNHNYGCFGVKVLEALKQLETQIDEAANTAQWVK